MGYMEDYAEKSNKLMQQRAAEVATRRMQSDITTWAEKVTLLEAKIAELVAELERVSRELANRNV